MNFHLTNVLSTLAISGVVVLLVAACGGGGDGGSAPNVAGDYVFSLSSYRVQCTDGASTVLPASSEMIRITQSGNSIVGQSLTFSADQFAEALGVDVLSISRTGRVRSDSTFSIEETAVLRDRFDGDIYDIQLNLDGTFAADRWSGQARISLRSRQLAVTCNGQPSFSGAKLSAGAELQSKPMPTSDIPFDVYDSPGVGFRLFGIE